MPTTIYNRDYNKITPEETAQYEAAIQRGIVKKVGELVIRNDSIYDYPKAARHNISLFPGHYLDPADLRDCVDDFSVDIDELAALIDDKDKSERNILKFIKEKKAYFIIGSIAKKAYSFGHHDLYLFPEFELNASYKPDYVLVGGNSDGYHFIFIELENPYGRISKADGDFGEVLVKGIHQVELWRQFIESQWASLSKIFQKALKEGDPSLPNEFYQYDATRIHFAVIALRRANFASEFARRKRRNFLEQRIRVMHYDNLLDQARLVLGEITY